MKMSNTQLRADKIDKLKTIIDSKEKELVKLKEQLNELESEVPEVEYYRKKYNGKLIGVIPIAKDDGFYQYIHIKEVTDYKAGNNLYVKSDLIILNNCGDSFKVVFEEQEKIISLSDVFINIINYTEFYPVLENILEGLKTHILSYVPITLNINFKFEE